MQPSSLRTWLTVVMLLSPALVPPVHGAELRALLIGIQSYHSLGAEWSDLEGPLNDVQLMRQLLEEHGFSPKRIRTLQDREATGEAIRKAFDRLVQEAGPGDFVVIHYSGHGSMVADANGDEGARGKDCTLVPIDARNPKSFEILDDEIGLWVRQLREKSALVLLTVDACHSGTISRAVNSFRNRGALIQDQDPRVYLWSTKLKAERTNKSDRGFVRVSACQDIEQAREYLASDGRVYGFFTWHWVQALKQVSESSFYYEAFRIAEASMVAERGRGQLPVYEGPRDMGVFGTGPGVGPRLAAVRSTKGKTISFRGGVLNGICQGGILEALDEFPAAQVRIDTCWAFESIGELMEGAVPHPGQLFQLKEARYPFPDMTLSVNAENPGDEPWAERLRKALGSVRGVKVVGDVVHPEILLQVARDQASDGAIGPKALLLDATERPYGGGRYNTSFLTTALTDSNDAITIVNKVTQLLENRALCEASSELFFQPLGVEFNLGYLEANGVADLKSSIKLPERWRQISRSSGGLFEVCRDDTIAFWVRNPGTQGLYIYCVDLLPNGGRDVFPSSGDNSRVPPGGTCLLGDLKGCRWFRPSEAGCLETFLFFITDKPGYFGDLEAPGFEKSNSRGAGMFGFEWIKGTLSRSGISSPSASQVVTTCALVIRVQNVDRRSSSSEK